MSNPTLKRKVQLELKKKLVGLSSHQQKELMKFASSIAAETVEQSKVPQPKLDPNANPNVEIKPEVVAPDGTTAAKADINPKQTKLDPNANPNVEIKPEVIKGKSVEGADLEKAASMLKPFEGNSQFEEILAARVVAKYYQKYASTLKQELVEKTKVPQPKLDTSEANAEIKPKVIAPDGKKPSEVQVKPEQTTLDTSESTNKFANSLPHFVRSTRGSYLEDPPKDPAKDKEPAKRQWGPIGLDVGIEGKPQATDEVTDAEDSSLKNMEKQVTYLTNPLGPSAGGGAVDSARKYLAGKYGEAFDAAPVTTTAATLTVPSTLYLGYRLLKNQNLEAKGLSKADLSKRIAESEQRLGLLEQAGKLNPSHITEHNRLLGTYNQNFAGHMPHISMDDAMNRVSRSASQAATGGAFTDLPSSTIDDVTNAKKLLDQGVIDATQYNKVERAFRNNTGAVKDLAAAKKEIKRLTEKVEKNKGLKDVAKKLDRWKKGTAIAAGGIVGAMALNKLLASMYRQPSNVSYGPPGRYY